MARGKKIQPQHPDSQDWFVPFVRLVPVITGLITLAKFTIGDLILIARDAMTNLSDPYALAVIAMIAGTVIIIFVILAVTVKCALTTLKNIL